MSDATIHGVVEHVDSSRKTDYLYRLSIKGLVINENNEVLVVKETGRDFWDMPGGGMDHGESIKQAIARELYEEVSLQGNFRYLPIAVEDPKLLVHSSILQVRMIFHVIPDTFAFAAGTDGDEAMFADPERFKDSEHFRERQIYEYARTVIK